jgi:hypothetical protein
MAIILRTAYFFKNQFCIKQVPIDCSKVNPMEQKYFVLANNVFSDGCGGYLTIGTEITLADTIGKNSEDWGLLLHVAGGGEDYWITGTAAEFRTDCECVPECNCVLTFETIDLFPEEGSTTTTYIARTGATAGVYIWSGSAYVLITSTALGYKVYRALLNQSGGVPVATVLENNLGGTPVYAGNGPSTCTLTGLFTLNKTFVRIGNHGASIGNGMIMYSVYGLTVNSFTFASGVQAFTPAGQMVNTPIEILVYN